MPLPVRRLTTIDQMHSRLHGRGARPTSDGGGGAPMQHVAREHAQRSLTCTRRADHVGSRR